MGLMTGKRGVIFGVANDRSIAWGIARTLHEEGASLAFTYLNEVFEKRVRPLAESLQSDLILRCDVQNDEEIDGVYTEIEQKWGSLDFVVHSVAYAGREELKLPFHQTTREGFRIALDISAYSLIAVSRAALRLMANGGSILTLTYLGSQRAVPNYNVMGVAKAALEATVRYLAAELGEKAIRVNAISAGPIRTLAASAISNISEIFGIMESRSPMHRSVTQEEVGKPRSTFSQTWRAASRATSTSWIPATTSWGCRALSTGRPFGPPWPRPTSDILVEASLPHLPVLLGLGIPAYGSHSRPPRTTHIQWPLPGVGGDGQRKGPSACQGDPVSLRQVHFHDLGALSLHADPGLADPCRPRRRAGTPGDSSARTTKLVWVFDGPDESLSALHPQAGSERAYDAHVGKGSESGKSQKRNQGRKESNPFHASFLMPLVLSRSLSRRCRALRPHGC